MDAESQPLPEDHRVELWRHEQLTRMGFSDWQIVRLQDWQVDLHEAEYLMTRGCHPAVALAILEPIS